MILAGVLLKLGGYGFIRFYYFISGWGVLYRCLLIRFSLISMVYVGGIRIRITDLKSLIAYSSVSHIAIVAIGLLTISSLGYRGGVLMILGHGLSSSGLFYLINLIYVRMTRRRIYINKGILLIPILRGFIFFFVIANVSCPPSLGFISEIFLMIRIMSFRYTGLFILYLGRFMVAIFSLFFF